MTEGTCCGRFAAGARVWDRLDYGMILPYVMLYSGAIPLPTGRWLQSRHIEHLDNRCAEDQAYADLTRVGRGLIRVRKHQFDFAGLTLSNIEGEIRGEDEELLFITAHLDSTAGDTDPKTTPAPGADDNASGIAGVLAIADVMATAIATGQFRPRHTIRFVLFNAEEFNLIGSHLYVRELERQQAIVLGAFQMDMIGYSKKPPPRRWELHYGFKWDRGVTVQSRNLAMALARRQPSVSPNLRTPILFGDDDLASNRSDHSSFHGRYFPALCASEAYFCDANEPTCDPNPNRDTTEDTFVDPHYAADIARVIGATVCDMAMCCCTHG